MATHQWENLKNPKTRSYKDVTSSTTIILTHAQIKNKKTFMNIGRRLDVNLISHYQITSVI